MNRVLLLVGIGILFGCNSKPKQDFPVPDKNDINEIVRAVIIQDSLSYEKIPVSNDLRKLKIYVPKGNNNIPPPPNFYQISIKHLINKNLFNKKDSSYIMFQNDTFKHFKFSNQLITNIKLTTKNEQEQNRKLNRHERFFELSIPVFSLDQKQAYVQINRFCPFCGSGTDIFLKKQDGKWKIIKQYMSWIN